MDLAAEIDVDRAYIGTLERAEANPTVKKLARLAKALGVHAADLLDDRGKQTPGLASLAIERRISHRPMIRAVDWDSGQVRQYICQNIWEVHLAWLS